ncbi:MAG: TetR/AcrR family transcriptional regulator [Saprospiraceae bacterium]|nr:TetR/AcrR family transcriptional regulator [Lewinella sp.]
MTAKTKKSGKREMILERAKDIFSGSGYEKTTLENIGESCGLNKASLYYYFRNKEEIYVEVILKEATEFILQLQEELKSVSGTENKIHHYLLSRIQKYAERLNLSQLSMESIQKVEPIFQDLFQQVKNEEILFLRQILDEGIAQGEIEPVESTELAEALFVISDALKHERMLVEKPYPNHLYNYTKVEHQLSLMLRLLFKGISLN